MIEEALESDPDGTTSYAALRLDEAAGRKRSGRSAGSSTELVATTEPGTDPHRREHDRQLRCERSRGPWNSRFIGNWINVNQEPERLSRSSMSSSPVRPGLRAVRRRALGGSGRRPRRADRDCSIDRLRFARRPRRARNRPIVAALRPSAGPRSRPAGGSSGRCPCDSVSDATPWSARCGSAPACRDERAGAERPRAAISCCVDATVPPAASTTRPTPWWPGWRGARSGAVPRRLPGRPCGRAVDHRPAGRSSWTGSARRCWWRSPVRRGGSRPSSAG